MNIKAFICLVLSIVMSTVLKSQNHSMMVPPFNNESALKFTELALACINTEYPYNYVIELKGKDDLVLPERLHPVFCNCFNWQSSVKSIWVLVKMLQLYPDLPNRVQIISELSDRFTDTNIQQEIISFQQNKSLGYSRPYGWSWLLKLAADLSQGTAEHEKKWFNALFPLSEIVKKSYYDYLPGLYYPVRKGNSENTALGIAFALDYALAMNDKTFENFLKERANFYYLNDRKIPASWEPGGEDIISPSLVEAELMRRVLARNEFTRWFNNFMPEMPFTLTYPALVSNRNDNKGSNLDVLNLSRAWCMFELAKALPDDSHPHRELWQAGFRHAAEALPNLMGSANPESFAMTAYAVLMYLSIANIIN